MTSTNNNSYIQYYKNMIISRKLLELHYRTDNLYQPYNGNLSKRI